MICRNCGGEYDESLSQCPYCGTEDIGKAAMEQENCLNELRRETENLKKKPEKAAEKATKATNRLIAALILAFVLILAGVAGVSALRSAGALNRQERHVERLEALYQAGEYEEMGEYLSSVDNYGGTFEKYRRVDRLYTFMGHRIAALENDRLYAGAATLDPENVAEDLYHVFTELNLIREMEEEGFPYGEREGALYVKERYYQVLRDCALLADEEIENAMALTEKEDAQAGDFTELAEIVIGRMEKAS